jgi:hypothetical protein
MLYPRFDGWVVLVSVLSQLRWWRKWLGLVVGKKMRLSWFDCYSYDAFYTHLTFFVESWIDNICIKEIWD